MNSLYSRQLLEEAWGLGVARLQVFRPSSSSVYGGLAVAVLTSAQAWYVYRFEPLLSLVFTVAALASSAFTLLSLHANRHASRELDGFLGRRGVEGWFTAEKGVLLLYSSRRSSSSGSLLGAVFHSLGERSSGVLVEVLREHPVKGLVAARSGAGDVFVAAPAVRVVEKCCPSIVVAAAIPDASEARLRLGTCTGKGCVEAVVEYRGGTLFYMVSGEGPRARLELEAAPRPGLLESPNTRWAAARATTSYVIASLKGKGRVQGEARLLPGEERVAALSTVTLDHTTVRRVYKYFAADTSLGLAASPSLARLRFRLVAKEGFARESVDEALLGD